MIVQLHAYNVSSLSFFKFQCIYVAILFVIQLLQNSGIAQIYQQKLNLNKNKIKRTRPPIFLIIVQIELNRLTSIILAVCMGVCVCVYSNIYNVISCEFSNYLFVFFLLLFIVRFFFFD